MTTSQDHGFQKYQHVERFGTTEVEGIEYGECYIFPKLDGTNAQVWMDDMGIIRYGSRKRVLSLDDDNAGFMAWASQQGNITAFMEKHPDARLFGEWLVPHSLKTYREDAWRMFYVFDVAEPDEGERGHRYIPFDEYRPMLEEFGIQYVVPVCIIRNPSIEQLYEQLPQNTFLVKDGEGAGEGIVIKRYDYRNKYGRQTWAKIVTSEFKEKHVKAMGATVKLGPDMIEQDIAEHFITTALVEKEYAKIVNEEEGWSSRMIPRLLNTVYHAFITEEMWEVLKRHKNARIDFKRLQHFVFNTIKIRKPELF